MDSGLALRAPRNDSLENFPVLDESEIIGDLVIERAGLRVARLGQPVHPAGARRLGLAVNLLDQRAANAPAAGVLGDEQVLEIAVAVMRPGRAMEQVMRNAEQPAVDIAAERKQRLVRIVKPRPCEVADLLRQRRLVEREIAGPQRIPGLPFVLAQGANDD